MPNATMAMPIEEVRGGFPVILIGDEIARASAETAVDASGGRVVGMMDWAEVAGGLGGRATAVIVMIEAAGGDADLLASALPRIDEAAATLDAPVIAAFDRESIDVVAAGLLNPRTQLLCEPTAAERVAALMIAAETLGTTMVSDTWREGEAARLRRLNDEVARIADVLARLTRRDGEQSGGGEVADRRQTFAIEPQHDVVIDAGEVRKAIRARRMRDQQFGTGIFEEPGWDMVLDLFAAELERVQVSVSSLCIAAAVAPTTALRWIAKMTEAGLLERNPDPFDRRRAFMALSARASAAMRDHVAALRRAGLSLA